jgi:hypothetical protein
MKIRWSILALQLVFIINGLFLIIIGLVSIRNYFAHTRMYVSVGIILINVAVILSYLHRSPEISTTPIQAIFAPSQQGVCSVCSKPNIIKADYCSVCGHQMSIEKKEK